MSNDPLDGSRSTPLASEGFDFNRPTVIGLLYLASLLTGVTAIVGIVLCYVWRSEAHQPWEATHYVYLARTFWLGLIACVVGVITMIVGIGFLILGLIGIWWIVRTVLSLVNAQRRMAMSQPDTLLF